MKSSLKKRLARLEAAIIRKSVVLIAFEGKNKAEEDIIKQHLTSHPEDAGAEFKIMTISYVTAKNCDIIC
jgi:hypothetical protein